MGKIWEYWIGGCTQEISFNCDFAWNSFSLYKFPRKWNIIPRASVFAFMYFFN